MNVISHEDDRGRMLEEFLSSYWSYLLAAVSLLMSLCISVFTLFQHLLHYTAHKLQGYIVRILVFIPIYGVLTFLLLCFPSAEDALEMARNIWEGLLIHSFLCLMMEYCGGESECGDCIFRDPAVIRHFWPLSRLKILSLNEDIPLNAGFVKRCRMSTMQYAFIRPILAILVILLRLFGFEDSSFFRALFTLVVNISVYSALYALGLFYMAIRNHPGLSNAHCLAKFISLKICVVFTFYQKYAIIWLSGLSYEARCKFETFLVLLELPLFANIQGFAYNVLEFRGKNSEKSNPTVDLETHSSADLGVSNVQSSAPQNSPDGSVLSHIEWISKALGVDLKDVKYMASLDGCRIILNNAKSAFNMKDLFIDLYYNFSDRYRKHSILPQSCPPPAKDKTGDLLNSFPKEPVENFAEFDRAQSILKLEEDTNTLSKLQFL